MTITFIDRQMQLNRLQYRLQQHMQQYGYMNLPIPSLDKADIFMTRAGNQIIDELISFEHKGQQFALRPEFTASAAQIYSMTHEGEPVRWQFGGVVYRDTENEALQRYSSGAEYIGDSSYRADAEIIAVAIKGLDVLGISDWELVIGHVGLLLQLLKQYHLDSRTKRLLLSQRNNVKQLKELASALAASQPQQMEDGSYNPNTYTTILDDNTQRMLDVLLDSTRYGTTMGGRSSSEIAQRLIEKHMREANQQQIWGATRFLENWQGVEGSVEAGINQIISLAENDDEASSQIHELQALVEALKNYGIPEGKIKLKPDLARDWEYYTGVTFEVRCNDEILAAGGRYDELIGMVGEKHTGIPAVGYAFYLDNVLKYTEVTETRDNINLLQLIFNDHLYSEAIALAQALRSQNINVVLISNDQPINHKQAIILMKDRDTVSYRDKDYSIENIELLTKELKDLLR